MHRASLARALERVESHLLATDSDEACIAAFELRGDQRRVPAATARIVAERHADGSWGGDLESTASALSLLADMDPNARRRGVTRAVREGIAWIRSRRGAPGRYGEGCDPERHADGLCHHFLAGFFSFGPRAPANPLAEGRLVASCDALRALLRWEAPGGDDALHLDAARVLLERWTRWDERHPRPAGYLAALALVIAAPWDSARDAAADHGMRIVARTQRGDGSWPDADPFAVLEVLDLALRRGRRADYLDSMLESGAALLAATQNERGVWGRDSSTGDLLVAWRILKRAAGDASAEAQPDGATGSGP